MTRVGRGVVQLLLLALLAFNFAHNVGAQEPEEEEDDALQVEVFEPAKIIDLTGEGFDDFVENTEDPIIVEIHDSECTECAKVESSLMKAQLKAKIHGINFTLARVDRDKEESLYRIFRPRDWSGRPPPLPHLHFRSGVGKKDAGKWKPYNGGKEPIDILRWLAIETSAVPPTKFKSLVDLEAFIDKLQAPHPFDSPFTEKPVLVGFFPRHKRSVELRRFKSLIDELRTRTQPELKDIPGAVGIYFAGSKKDATPTTVVVKNTTISVPSLVLFKRGGQISIYNPPPPKISEEEAPEEATPVEAEEVKQEEGEPVEKVDVIPEEKEEASTTDEATIFFGNEEPEEKEEEAKKEKKKKEKLSKEEKKLRRQQEWKQLQRKTSWRLISMIEWIKQATHALVADTGHWNFAELLQKGKPFYVAWVDRRPTVREEATGRFYEDTVATLKKIAPEYADKFTFGVVGGDRYPAIARAFGVQDLFGYLIVEPASEHRYLPAGTLDVDGDEEAFIRKHIEDYLAGNLTPYIRSAPVPPPETNEDNPKVYVKTVVYNSFKRLVLDETRDVLIYYYNPSDENCKTFEPIMEEVGKNLAADSNIRIAKMELDNNDLPLDAHVKITAVPTLVLYRVGEKEAPIGYQQDRTAAAILEWVDDYRATPPYTGPNRVPPGRRAKEEL